MHTSEMMAGVLVIGAIQSQETPHLGQYITKPTSVRKVRNTVPVRVSVKKYK